MIFRKAQESVCPPKLRKRRKDGGGRRLPRHKHAAGGQGQGQGAHPRRGGDGCRRRRCRDRHRCLLRVLAPFKIDAVTVCGCVPPPPASGSADPSPSTSFAQLSIASTHHGAAGPRPACISVDAIANVEVLQHWDGAAVPARRQDERKSQTLVGEAVSLAVDAVLPLVDMTANFFPPNLPRAYTRRKKLRTTTPPWLLVHVLGVDSGRAGAFYPDDALVKGTASAFVELGKGTAARTLAVAGQRGTQLLAWVTPFLEKLGPIQRDHRPDCILWKVRRGMRQPMIRGSSTTGTYSAPGGVTPGSGRAVTPLLGILGPILLAETAATVATAAGVQMALTVMISTQLIQFDGKRSMLAWSLGPAFAMTKKGFARDSKIGRDSKTG
ncbi:hypothetical protein B0H13DRAFT_1923738 [Mycena leptocephala]|nr:hypothetical protein B0H13DRAFT_1923738 [Mycena leptocephala]